MIFADNYIDELIKARMEYNKSNQNIYISEVDSIDELIKITESIGATNITKKLIYVKNKRLRNKKLDRIL
jgi:hypothetical protein